MHFSCLNTSALLQLIVYYLTLLPFSADSHMSSFQRRIERSPAVFGRDQVSNPGHQPVTVADANSGGSSG